MQGIFWDVTDRMHAEEQLRDSEARKRAILETAMDCIFFLDQRGQIVEANHTAAETLCRDRQELVGCESAQLLRDSDVQQRFRAGLHSYVQQNRIAAMLGQRVELHVNRQKGESFAGGGDGAGEGAPEAPFVVQVNEAGASVYSASDLAREEFPELDLTIRGAISVARRLQDPLAELVKIEPKSIGVGQYQHDVHQPLMSKKLGDVVEDCVNRVGVELNTASAQLLGYVAGIGKSLAKKIVVHRDAHGAFGSRQQLMDVSGLGPRTFEQAAGFLRIADAPHPLDRSAVHPERYPLVEQIAADLGVPLPELIGNQDLVDKIDF